MQQTQKYKLNLIESSDPFMPEGLNQNTQKVEEVLAAQEAANDQKVAAVAGQVTALGAASDQKLAEMNQRVTVLEGHRCFVGSYVGDGTNNRFINLGVTPLAVIIPGMCDNPFLLGKGLINNGHGIVDNGFVVSNNGSYSPNYPRGDYMFLVLT